MNQYELMFLVGESKEMNTAAIRQEVAAIVTEEGGTLEEKFHEFKRRLAYPIKHEQRGTYVIQRFTLPDQDEFDGNQQPADREDLVANMHRKLTLNTNVLRALIVRAEGLPEFKAEEPMMVRRPAARIETRRPVSRQPEKPRPTATDAAEKKKVQENIDEKLEEILNI